MCSTNYADNQATSDITRFSSVVSVAGLAAFNNCVKNSASGLIIDTNYNEDVPNVVVITAKFLPSGIPGKNHLSGVQIVSDPSNPRELAPSCDGELYSAAIQRDKLTPGKSYAMTCRRPGKDDPKDAFLMLGNKILAAPAEIVVGSDPGTITFEFPTIPKPSEEADFLTRLSTHSGGIRLNFTLGGVGDRKPGNGQYWRIATYVVKKSGNDATITGFFPKDCFKEPMTCVPPTDNGNFTGLQAFWDEASRTIKVGEKSQLTYDAAGLLYDSAGKGPVGYISFDP